MSYRSYKLLSVFIFFTVIGLPLIVNAQIPEESQKYRDVADYNMIRGNIKEAIKNYREALLVYPDQPDIYLLLGQIYEYDLRDPEKGVFYYQKYLDLNPDGKDAQKARDFIQLQKKKGIYKKKYPKAFDVIVTPSSDEEEELSERQEELFDLQSSDGIVKFKIEARVMKYQIKINIWEKEGFIERFNELARLRACPLQIDIAAKREVLRKERDKVTKNINYRKEAINEMKIMALLKALSSLGLDLNNYPENLNPEHYLNMYTILKEKEDKRFIHLVMEASVNIEKLKEDLKKAGYEDKTREISIALLHIDPELRDTLENFLFNRSKYVAVLDDGPRKIYTSPKLFSEEIAGMRIGPYGFIPLIVGTDTVSFKVKKIK